MCWATQSPRFALLLLGLLLCSARGRGGPRAKQDKSPDSARLRREHPADPVKWFDQINVHFKAGDKAKVSVAEPAALCALTGASPGARAHAVLRAERADRYLCACVRRQISSTTPRGTSRTSLTWPSTTPLCGMSSGSTMSRCARSKSLCSPRQHSAHLLTRLPLPSPPRCSLPQ
jgi:hypothetical protein